jgi:hypothetical protein
MWVLCGSLRSEGIVRETLRSLWLKNVDEPLPSPLKGDRRFVRLCGSLRSEGIMRGNSAFSAVK